MKRYYTTLEHFSRMYKSIYRPYACKVETAAEYAAWQSAFRRKLNRLLGHDKMTKADGKILSEGVEALDGYTREKLILETEPDVWMTMYLLKPDGPPKVRPVVIAPHGHGSNGKSAVCGIDFGVKEMADTISVHNYDYGVQFVKQGFMVFCPDARGFGERREGPQQGDKPQELFHCSCAYLNDVGRSLGQCVTGMWTWDLMRLIDHIETRDDADPGRIGVAGLSGGGLQSLWLSAMDARVKYAVVSGYFYGYDESILWLHCCACNYVPELWLNCDIGDVGALSADRGIFIETGDRDGLNGPSNLANVIPQVDVVRRAANVLGNGHNVGHHIFSGEHKWCGEQSIPWMVEKLRP